MITRLRAENFKSWKDTGELRLAPLTGLFGTNSSGKSSILQILLMLKQTVDHPDPNRVLHLGGDSKSLVDLGTFHDVIHDHRANTNLKLSLAWDVSETPDAIPPHLQRGKFEVSLEEHDKLIKVSEFAYTVGSQREGMVARLDEKYDFMHNDQPVGPPMPLPIKSYGFPLEAVAKYRTAGLYTLARWGFENTLGRLKYLGPLRQYPQRTYLWGGSEPSDVGREGADAVQALLAASSGVAGRVANWLKGMNLVDSFRLQPIAENRKDYEVRVKKTPTSAEVLLPDVGFGVSQILPVLVICYYVPGGSTVILEQPEIHLHPSAQSELADVLMDVVKNRKVQIIVESHSEHLLRRLQRRIAEEKFPAADAALYFCEMENGASKATELQIGDDGFIKNWPDDFFGDEMGEVAAIAKAGIKHRRSRTG